MNPRELVILSLGLAIVAVVLRGLYVALRARRGQLRLAIDKNIPRDIDLDSLELAELPGGGARIVERSFKEVNRQNSAVDTANVRAAAIALGRKSEQAEAVPVLMDPVEIHDAVPAAANRQSGRHEVAEDPDSVLFDYPDADVHAQATGEAGGATAPARRVAIDTLSNVKPDYDDDDGFDDDDEDDEDFDDYEDDEEDFADEDSPETEFEEDDFEDDDAEDDDADADAEDEDEDDLDLDEELDDDDYDAAIDDMEDDEDADYDADLDFENDDDVDEFSMTAGERIGFAGTSHRADRTAEEKPAPVSKRRAEKAEKPRRPLFAAFGRALKSRDTEPEVEVVAVQSRQPQSKPVPVTPQSSRRNRPEEVQKPAEPIPVQKAAPEFVATEPSEVIVLNVMAKPGREFSGDDLLHVLITSGMKFGDMNIFHRRLAGENKGPVIFSAANILNPGVFDLNRMHEFTTLGISLFLALPTPVNNLEAFVQMLDVARNICGALDGELRDDNRNLMTAQTIEHYRQRIRDFELRRLKAVGTRG